MPQPNPYAKATDFAEYQTDHQSAPFNGALLDAELVDIETNLDDLNTNIGLIQRDDGALANACVSIESLSTATLALIASEAFSVEGSWVTATAYAVGDIVAKDAVAYICLVAHTSGTFSTDLAAEKWVGMSAVASQTDANFQILGSGDSTKIAKFEVDGFTTATTRTFTLPDRTGTIATLEGNQTFTGNIAIQGNTTIGDASGDSLTINAGTHTIGSNYTATRAAGALAAGAVNVLSHVMTCSSDSGGTTNAVGWLYQLTHSGANAAALVRTKRVYGEHAGSNTVTTFGAGSYFLAVSSTGNVTTARMLNTNYSLTAAGNVTTAVNYNAGNHTLSSTGAITTAVGFNAQDLGHATLVGTAIGFRAEDQTGSVTLNAAFQGQLSAGTNKFNCYMSGDAVNYFAGATRIGATAAYGSGQLQVSNTTAAIIDAFTWVAGTAGSSVVLGKSRAAAAGSYTVVQSADTLGSISFKGADGSAMVVAATITATVDGTPGANDMPGAITFATTADGASSATNRVKIGCQGNVILNASGSALATNATGGFTYIPSCAGTPTGVPAVLPTGALPMVIDSSTNKLYFYSGGAWRDAGP